MRPITTAETAFEYGAPPGMEDEIGGFPCCREPALGRNTTIYSVWEPTESERKLIALGHNLRLGIHGMEPIPPVSLAITHLANIDDDEEAA